MRVKDETKIKVIHFINKYEDYLRGTSLERDIKSIKKRYIYKDISNDEFKKDILYLQRVKMLIFSNKK